MRELDIDDGWNLEELPARDDIDDGWFLAEESAPRAAPSKPRCQRRSHIVRLPGRVVIYPRSAARERRLAAFWKAALEADSAR